MDLFIDRDGVVMVRNCGCPLHGLNSLWDSHDEDWKQQHRKGAEIIVAEHGKGLREPHERRHLDKALDNIRGQKAVI